MVKIPYAESPANTAGDEELAIRAAFNMRSRDCGLLQVVFKWMPLEDAAVIINAQKMTSHWIPGHALRRSVRVTFVQVEPFSIANADAQAIRARARVINRPDRDEKTSVSDCKLASIGTEESLAWRVVLFSSVSVFSKHFFHS